MKKKLKNEKNWKIKKKKNIIKGDNQIKFSKSQISGSGDPRVQISPNFGCRPYGPCRIDCAGQPAASSKKIVRFSQNNCLRLRTGLRSSDFKFFWNRFARTRERDQNVPKNGWFWPNFWPKLNSPILVGFTPALRLTRGNRPRWVHLCHLFSHRITFTIHISRIQDVFWMYYTSILISHRFPNWEFN